MVAMGYRNTFAVGLGLAILLLVDMIVTLNLGLVAAGISVPREAPAWFTATVVLAIATMLSTVGVMLLLKRLQRERARPDDDTMTLVIRRDDRTLRSRDGALLAELDDVVVVERLDPTNRLMGLTYRMELRWPAGGRRQVFTSANRTERDAVVEALGVKRAKK
jgi:hypothetical protein